ncbi:MAG: methionyl-tRNA formyltransferase [Myxococcales bacterium]|nr:methionyl-tRNA formyltransferase [Myxococcales bacterium]
MRLVFFGATELGLACCEAAIADQEVVGIVSMPREFDISYSPTPVRNVTYADFESLAARHGIPYQAITSGKAAELLPTLEAWQPDIGLAIGWFYIVPAEVRQLFPLGVLGVHASLLPKYRGGAPLTWAMINRERQTGVTLFHLDDGVDTGDVVAQKSFAIESDEDIADVLRKATVASVALVREGLQAFENGTATRVVQDHATATSYPQRKPDDGLIDWGRPASEIAAFIRAQTRPYPGAFTVIEGKRVTIWSADVEDAEAGP